MKHSLLRRSAIVSLCIVSTMLVIAANAAAQGERNNNPKISSHQVLALSNGAVVPAAGSTVFRTATGVYFDFHTSSLTPGHAVTEWLAVFNNPEFCATDPCTPADFANPAVDATMFTSGGVVVGPDGKAVFGGYRAVGDLAGARPNFGTGHGLVKPMTAEIQLVARTHGMANLADPAVLEQQLTVFSGGCPPNTCISLQISIH
jgi:hypothetical protein